MTYFWTAILLCLSEGYEYFSMTTQSIHAHTSRHKGIQTPGLLARTYLPTIAYCFKGNPATTVCLICMLHQVHTEQRAVRPDADTEGRVSGCRAAVCPSQGGGGSWSLIISVECTQRKLGQRLQTVTLSDPYWNSQQNNNGTLTNLISYAMTRNIIVSEWWKIKKERESLLVTV